MKRRRLLLAAPALLAAAPAGAAPRIAVLDYGLAQTLLALGLPPVAMPDPADYRNWVVEPALAPGVVDLGQRTQPNLELLAALRPDAILVIADHEPIVPLLSQIAPVLRLPIHGADRDPWARSVAAARTIGARWGREAAAEALIRDTDAAMAAGRGALARQGPLPPLLLASFADPRHLRVYGLGSILHSALERLGLRNAWTGRTGLYGSATVGLDALAPLGDALLVTIEPDPPDLGPMLAASPLWQALPWAQAGRRVSLPPVLMFGTLPAASRLAALLLPRLLPHG